MLLYFGQQDFITVSIQLLLSVFAPVQKDDVFPWEKSLKPQEETDPITQKYTWKLTCVSWKLFDIPCSLDVVSSRNYECWEYVMQLGNSGVKIPTFAWNSELVYEIDREIGRDLQTPI